MTPGEELVLKTLRQTTLASLSANDFAAIEKAVEENGIRNLTGLAKRVVETAVAKHGTSHDQGSHGNWAKGGGVGSASGGVGGASKNPSNRNEAIVAQKIDGIKGKVDSLQQKISEKRTKLESKKDRDFFEERELTQTKKLETAVTRVQDKLAKTPSRSSMSAKFAELEEVQNILDSPKGVDVASAMNGLGGIKALQGIRAETTRVLNDIDYKFGITD
jgi:hypothetical protein